jgi:hypothetical protein
MIRSKEVSAWIWHLEKIRGAVQKDNPEVKPHTSMGARIIRELCWKRFSPAERDWISQELIRCRRDFRYFAGNYVWLFQPRSGRPQLLDLNDSQEWIMEIIEKQWSLGKPGRILLHKARQLGMSELSMSLGVHQSVFFSNRVIMMIAQDASHAPYTFAAFQYKLFNLPYWMQPNVDSLERKELMVLAARDEGGAYGGLNNYILSFQIEKMSAFAQGKAVTFLWGTEISNWDPEKARRVIKGDLTEALVKRPGTVAILESKPEGAAGFWHNFWHQHAGKGLRSAWYSAFLPVFAERSRVAKVPPGFKPREDEIIMREQYSLEWRRCTHCSTAERPIYYHAGGNRNAECLKCGESDGEPVILSDEQLGWYRTRKAEADDPKNPDRRRDMKLFKQECARTAEEGFQILEDQVFPDDVIAAVEMSVMDPSWLGELRPDFSWHNKIPLRCPRPECNGLKHCLTCHQDHSEEEMYLSVWEFPKPGAVYHIGVDASYGFEEGDYGVIHVLRQGSGMVNPDLQVAEYRGRIDAGELGKITYLMAVVYNYAEVAIEVQNGPGEKTQYQLTLMNYSNLWRWKHYDAIRPYTNRLGWVTNARTKPMLIQTFIQWTRQNLVKMRSKQFLYELKSFVRRVDYDESGSGSAARGRTDDCVTAGLINVFTFHDEHFDEERGRIIIPQYLTGEQNPEVPGQGESRYYVTCLNGHTAHTDQVRGWVCAECKRLAKERGLDPKEVERFNVYARSAFATKQADPQRRIDFDADPREWMPAAEAFAEGGVFNSDQVEVV